MIRRRDFEFRNYSAVPSKRWTRGAVRGRCRLPTHCDHYDLRIEEKRTTTRLSIDMDVFIEKVWRIKLLLKNQIKISVSTPATARNVQFIEGDVHGPLSRSGPTETGAFMDRAHLQYRPRGTSFNLASWKIFKIMNGEKVEITNAELALDRIITWYQVIIHGQILHIILVKLFSPRRSLICEYNLAKSERIEKKKAFD